MSGYAHPGYAASFAEFGAARALGSSGGWVLERPVGASGRTDAMGCYPVFACRDWSALRDDLAAVGDDLVSLSLVTDPFGDFEVAELERCFPELCAPFKQHFVVDLARDPASFVDRHHQRNARRARARVRVERCDGDPGILDDWVGLYSTLTERHGIRGISAFSREAFRGQLGVPGLTAFRARVDERTVGMILWYTSGPVAYYHLAAYSEEGYRCGASFALFQESLEHFARQGLAWLSLGAGAGASGDGSDGLTRFKQGWATDTRTVFLCGRVFDPGAYAALSRAAGTDGSAYFPAYRRGEFA